MGEVRRGDLAIVVAGLWSNVGRIVYVADAVSDVDFLPMGLFIRTGWRIRSCSELPLQTIAGPAMAGLTPTGSLLPLDRLPDQLQAQLDTQMALKDLADLCRPSRETLDREGASDSLDLPTWA